MWPLKGEKALVAGPLKKEPFSASLSQPNRPVHSIFVFADLLYVYLFVRTKMPVFLFPAGPFPYLNCFAPMDSLQTEGSNLVYSPRLGSGFG